MYIIASTSRELTLKLTRSEYFFQFPVAINIERITVYTNNHNTSTYITTGQLKENIQLQKQPKKLQKKKQPTSTTTKKQQKKTTFPGMTNFLLHAADKFGPTKYLLS